MAVINAIKDATGCRIYELPATPDKVKAALAAKQNGQELKPAKYYLGLIWRMFWTTSPADPCNQRK